MAGAASCSCRPARASNCECARADEVGAPWDDGSATTGARIFGRDADFAEHFLNSDDVVPSTNFALPLCYVYDVTGSKERSAFFTPILSPTLAQP